MIIALATLFATNVNAQKVKKTEQITIKTSAQCEMCKERLEKEMAYEKGVVSSNLDIPTAVLTVVYKPTKTNPETIKKAINKTGYDADDLKADEKAYNSLPDCCKKDGKEHH